MSEFEKMLAGLEYNPTDLELRERSSKAKNLIKEYNNLPAENAEKREEYLEKILGGCGKNVRINQPFYVDYGCNISVDDDSIINMNCTFLDTNKIVIGKNAVIAPDVKIYTAFHPINSKERFKKDENGKTYLDTAASPVVIGNNVWIGGGSVILPGVKIGDNVVIGAGSVVTKSIPSDVIAFGNPCRVIRENK